MAEAGGTTAVVLFNLGGPDSPAAVRPFLLNLFNDPAIIRLPQPLRWLLARFITWRRADKAVANYEHMGGASPILGLTEQQAAALEAELGAERYRILVAMRYWHPRSAQAVAQLAELKPARIVLLPLFPQYSTTTVGSALADFGAAARRAGLACPTVSVCCYHNQQAFIGAHARLIAAALAPLAGERPRLLFSAHGLPEQVIAAGDPYQWQVEQTAAAVAERLATEYDLGDLDWNVCYQSRVGWAKWIGPATKDEIRRAGAAGRSLVVVPVAFVSEHLETLVELDIQYAELAAESGVPRYTRVPALGTEPGFIQALAELVRMAETAEDGAIIGDADGCPAGHARCPRGSNST